MTARAGTAKRPPRRRAARAAGRVPRRRDHESVRWPAAAGTDRRLRPRPVPRHERGRLHAAGRRRSRSASASIATVKIARNVEFHEEAAGMLRGALRAHPRDLDRRREPRRSGRSIRGARARPGRRAKATTMSRSRSARSSRRGSAGRPIPTRRATSGCAAAIAGSSRAGRDEEAAARGLRGEDRRQARARRRKPEGAVNAHRSSRVTVLEDRASVTRRGTLTLARRPAAHRDRARLAGARRQDADRDVRRTRACSTSAASATSRRGAKRDASERSRPRCAPNARSSRPRAMPRSRRAASRAPRAEALARARRRRAITISRSRAARGVARTDCRRTARRARRAGCGRARAPRRRRARRRRTSRPQLDAPRPARIARAEAEAGEQAARLVIDLSPTRAGDATLTVELRRAGRGVAAVSPRAARARQRASSTGRPPRASGRRPARTGPTSSSRCSLERPSLGVEPPALADDELRTRQASPTRSSSRRASRSSRHRPRRRARSQVPGIDDGGLGLAARPPADVTVRADGTPHRVPVGGFTTTGAGRRSSRSRCARRGSTSARASSTRARRRCSPARSI